MLDVSRHFFTKAEVEQLLDAMAWLKLNTFHWHLIDDQGWRVEIKKYPQLTQRSLAGGHRFRSRSEDAPTACPRAGVTVDSILRTDIREVVDLCPDRYITIVPEIEMPGHSTAALAVYPQFS